MECLDIRSFWSPEMYAPCTQRAGYRSLKWSIRKPIFVQTQMVHGSISVQQTRIMQKKYSWRPWNIIVAPILCSMQLKTTDNSFSARNVILFIFRILKVDGWSIGSQKLLPTQSSLKVAFFYSSYLHLSGSCRMGVLLSAYSPSVYGPPHITPVIHHLLFIVWFYQFVLNFLSLPIMDLYYNWFTAFQSIF